jgi:hypothetical protein
MRGSLQRRCPTRGGVEQRSNGLFLEENSKILIRCSVAHTVRGLLRTVSSAIYESLPDGSWNLDSFDHLSKITLGSVKGNLSLWSGFFPHPRGI